MIKAIILSLPRETERRRRIRGILDGYFDISIFDAVDGRSDHNSSLFENYEFKSKFRNREISRVEKACSLSHFLLNTQTPERNYIVFEDDVSGYNQELLEIFLFYENYSDGIYLLGGQNGLKLQKVFYFFWKVHFLVTGRLFLKLPRLIHGRIYRTCCYYIPNGPKKYFQKLDKLSLADDWKYLAKEFSLPVFFAPIFEHPSDLRDSVIEKARNKGET